MGKLTSYPSVAKFDSGDILIKDGSGGTKKITVEDAADEFAGLISAEQRRNVYRGKNLGSSISSAQKTAIQNGTFDDLFIGDYWVIGGINWRIADMDYWYNCGDTAFTKHHLVIVPDTALYNASMNDSNITTEGYVGSKMYTENLKQAKEKIQSVFGSMLLTHREYLVNAVTNGSPSGGAWFDSDVELMNEIMVYGTKVYSPMNNGSTIPTNYTIDKQQLSLFRLNPKMVNRRYRYWLRDVVSSAYFAGVSNGGGAYSYHASGSHGVRPGFPIG